MLSKDKVKAIADIFASVGHVFFGSVALPFWLEPKGASSILMVLTGLFIAICFWIVSVNLTE